MDIMVGQKQYLKEDFYFWAMILGRINEFIKPLFLPPELLRLILYLLHCIRRENAFIEYEKGKNENHIIAFEMLLSLGVEEKNGLVCYRLAHMYQYGKGCEKDRIISLRLYTQALNLLGDTALELFFEELFIKKA